MNRTDWQTPTQATPAPGLLRTFGLVLLRPSAFFARPAGARSRVSPLAFALLICVAPFFGLALVLARPILVGGAGLGRAVLFGLMVFLGGAALALLSLATTAGVAHALEGRARGSFAVTFEIVSYAQAPFVFFFMALLPTMIPAAVRWIWSGAALGAGLRCGYGISRTRASSVAALATILGMLAPVGAVLLIRAVGLEGFRIRSQLMQPALLNDDYLLVSRLHYGLRLPGGAHLFASPPQRGDIVAFTSSNPPDILRATLDTWPSYVDEFPDGGLKFAVNMVEYGPFYHIQRVIAVAGDTVDMRGRTVYVNGEPLPQTTLPSPCPDSEREHDKSPCTAYREDNHGVHYTVLVREEQERASALAFPIEVPPGMALVMADNRDSSKRSYWNLVPYDRIRGKAWRIWQTWSTSDRRFLYERIGRRVL